MLKEETPRCIQLMEQSVKSEVTRRSYKRELRVFLEFTKLEDYDELVSLEPKQFQILLENYIMHLKRRYEKGDLRARSFIPPIAALESFCVQNDILLNFKKVKKWIPKFEKLTGEHPYTNEDIQNMLRAANLRLSVVIHIFASTGIRPEALPAIKLKHVEPIGNNCTKLVIYPEDNEEYYAFLTPEATLVLQKYLEKRRFDGEKLSEESPLVRNAYQETEGWKDIQPIDISSLYGSFARLLKETGLRKPKKQLRERHEKRIFYGFRKRYNTILKDNKLVNVNTAEKLMGHKNGLDGVYYNPTIEKRFEEFKKAIPELTISEEDRQALKIKHQQEKISDLESNQQKISHLEEGMNILGAILAEQMVKNDLRKELDNPSHHHTKQQDLDMGKFVKSPSNTDVLKAFIEWSKRGS